MPTRYWLVDRDLVRDVSRLEAAGGVKTAEAEVAPDALLAAHRARTTRSATPPSPRATAARARSAVSAAPAGA